MGRPHLINIFKFTQIIILAGRLHQYQTNASLGWATRLIFKFTQIIILAGRPYDIYLL